MEINQDFIDGTNKKVDEVVAISNSKNRDEIIRFVLDISSPNVSGTLSIQNSIIDGVLKNDPTNKIYLKAKEAIVNLGIISTIFLSRNFHLIGKENEKNVANAITVYSKLKKGIEKNIDIKNKEKIAKYDLMVFQDCLTNAIKENNISLVNSLIGAYIAENSKIKDNEFNRIFDGIIGDGTLNESNFGGLNFGLGTLFAYSLGKTNNNLNPFTNGNNVGGEVNSITWGVRQVKERFDRYQQQARTTHTQTLNNVNGALDNINDAITQQEAQVEQSNTQESQPTNTSVEQQVQTAIQQQEQLNNTSNNLANASGELPTTLVEELTNRAGENNENANALWENIRNNENIEWLSEFGGQNLSREDKDKIKNIFKNVPGFSIIVFNAKLSTINQEKGK